jgi:hypothetical protein
VDAGEGLVVAIHAVAPKWPVLSVVLAYGGGWWVSQRQHFGAPSLHGQPGPVPYWLRDATSTLPLTAVLVALCAAALSAWSRHQPSPVGAVHRTRQLLAVLAPAAAGGLGLALTELVSLRMYFGLHGDPGPPPVWLLVRDGLEAFRADLLIVVALSLLAAIGSRTENEVSFHADPTQRTLPGDGGRRGDPAAGRSPGPAGPR